MNNTTRNIVWAIAILGIGIFTAKKIGGSKEETAGVDKTIPPKTVRVFKAEPTTQSAQVVFSGQLVAEQKIELYAELGGVLLSDKFKAGTLYKKGDVIAALDATELQNNIRAQRSELLTRSAGIMGDLKIDYPDFAPIWEGFLNKIDVNKSLPEFPEVSDAKIKRFLSAKGLFSTYFNIKSNEVKLNKAAIVAPYDGVLSMANFNKGTLVRAGQKMGEFINPNVYEFETEVAVADLAYVQTGYKMNLVSDDFPQTWQGVVSRVNSVINPTSQMVKVYVTVRGNGLKDGMYLYGKSEGKSFEEALCINRKLVQEGAVFSVRDSVLKKIPVQVLHVQEGTAIVQGVPNGAVLIADNMNGLKEGERVIIAK